MSGARSAAKATAGSRAGAAMQIAVDRIACDGRGFCGALLPERVTLDEWGYPILDPAPLGHDVLDHARRAVAQCPTLALRLQPL